MVMDGGLGLYTGNEHRRGIGITVAMVTFTHSVTAEAKERHFRGIH